MKITFGNLILLICFCIFSLTQNTSWIYGPFLFLSIISMFSCLHELDFLKQFSLKQSINKVEMKNFIQYMNSVLKYSSVFSICLNIVLMYCLILYEFYFTSYVFAFAFCIKILRDIIFNNVKTSQQYLNLKAAIEKLRTVS